MNPYPEQDSYTPVKGADHLQYITPEYSPVPRKIIAAANRLPNGVILVGARHWDTLMRQQFDALDLPDEDRRRIQAEADQGFVDQYSQYMSREDALRIARLNHQPLLHLAHDPQTQLFSEHLY